ncbi:MAG: alpha-ketoglutarate-dependent dioxygenase AlkB [Myxococcales bacterium]|nr:alpha-ketoglutarate-dependent dioxygenase AlkB [Myxococcales bacterium]
MSTRAPLRRPPTARPQRPPPGHVYLPGYVSDDERAAIVAWLGTLRPLWEERYSLHRPPPPGQSQRRLLRPVYWLGNWQFACLDYYRPPRGVDDRCVRAEPFPPVLGALARRIEGLARATYRGDDMPRRWHLNTCLVNFYGKRREGERWIDTARVGEHRDFEPGPVASISLGERALIQFVTSQRPGQRDRVVLAQWLEDASLQIFGGAFYKDRTFHRVQRVDTRGGFDFPPAIDGFATRRVNFTFRYVPEAHVIPFADLAPELREDIRPYVRELARASAFFRRELAREAAAGEARP